MAISGASLTVQRYFNPATNKMVDIELSVRDAVLFELLQQLVGAVKAAK